MEQFERRKKQQFSKGDRSSAGVVDERIRELCEKINKSKKYYTTSSCSGRIVLIKNIDKKERGLFFFVTHEKINIDELKRELKKAEQQSEQGKDKQDLIFKQEPCILAVACKNVEDASELLYMAREKAGWKSSGIMTLRKRIICELRSTEYISFPIMEKGKILVDDNFLDIIVKESNKRLEKSWEKIERLRKLM